MNSRINHPLAPGLIVDIEHPEGWITHVVVLRYDCERKAYRCAFGTALDTKGDEDLGDSAFCWVEPHEVLSVFGQSPIIPADPDADTINEGRRAAALLQEN